MSLIFTIKKAELQDAERLAEISVQGWQESYRGIIDQAYLDTISYAKRLKWRKERLVSQTPQSIHLMVCVNDEIIGFCDAGPTRHPVGEVVGEVYALYVLELYKKQGIGSALWCHATDHLFDQDLIPFMVWVLEKNMPARAFYEKQGGRMIKTEENDIGGRLYAEVCYEFGRDFRKE